MNIDQTAREMPVIGADISLEHMDIRCLPCGTSMRLSNDAKGHDKLVALAREKNALVGFEATGGCEWCPWKRLVDEGVRVRQYPPKQIKHFGIARGKGAKTDKDDAKNIALFMQFRPDAGRELPSDVLRELRAHVTFRAQLVEKRKRLKNEIEARKRQGLADLFDDESREQLELYKRQIDGIGKQIQRIITSDAILHRMAVILSSIPGIGFVATATLIAEMPEPGLISNRKVAALAGLAPYARDSGKMKGKRCIAGGRDCLRTVLYQAAIAALRSNVVLALFAKRLKDAGKPFKVFVIAVARKLVVIANAMIRNGTMWDPEANGKASTESASVETSVETTVNEAEPDGDCNLREDGCDGEAVEPMATARGGPSRSRVGKPGGRSGKTLE